MQVSLSPEIEAAIKEVIASGAFETPEAVLAEAIAVFLKDLAQKKERLMAELQIGIDQLERGETTPLDWDRLNAKYQEMRQNGYSPRTDSAALPSSSG